MCRVIGTGRTCIVYLAVHIGLKEYRAIKKISRDSSEYRDFRREAMILKNLKVPGIPVIYDLEEDEDYYYLIEEYLEGISFLELIQKEGALSKAMTVSIGIQICHLVYHLHSAEPNPILYLDLQPKNLLLCYDTVKLIDFGQAEFLQTAKNLKRRYGTMGYAAPEQYTDETLDERTDIYAIGRILYFLYTGNTKQKGGGQEKTGFRSDDIERIIGRCLETDREERYPSVNALCEELEKIRKDGEIKNPRSSLTIAFIAGKSGVGTTHLAIGLSEYLKIQGFPNLYEEKNHSDGVRHMAEYFGACPDDAGIVTISGLYMKPLYGQAVRLKRPQQMIRILDYGTDWKEMKKEDWDVVITVSSGKWWRADGQEEHMPARERHIVICNLAIGNFTVKRDRQKKGVLYIKAPYFETPFLLTLEAVYFYRCLMKNIWEGRGREKRICLPKRWLKRAGQRIKRLLVR